MSDLFDELNLLDDRRRQPYAADQIEGPLMHPEDAWGVDDDDDLDDEIEDFDYVGNFG